MGGGLKFFRPRWSPTGTKSDGGGLAKTNPTEAVGNCPQCKIRPLFAILSMKYSFLRYIWKFIWSLKVVKFDTKLYSNFSNFQGRTSAEGGGGGNKPWSKNGDRCRMGGGGLTKFSPDRGTPSPPRKKKNLRCIPIP